MEQYQQHTWNFSTVGGVKRVNLESGNDLMHLGSLDQKLWTALSCPINNLEIDPNTLALIDLDHDGQIRVPEILHAVHWMVTVLKNADDLLVQNPVFRLSSIDDTSDQGKTLLASANIILQHLGKPDADTLTVDETSDTEKIFAASRLNGDGIITEDTIGQPAGIAALNDIISCVGSLTDRGGKQGISAELLAHFFDTCNQYITWYNKSESIPGILVLGERTEEAYLSYIAIKDKADDYFLRCRLASFDPQTTDALNLSVDRVLALSPKNLAVSIGEMAEYPLAKIGAGKPLPLAEGLNPAWDEAMSSFKRLIGDTLYSGKTQLTETDWKKVGETFSVYTQWKSEKEGLEVEPIGPERIKELLNSTYKDDFMLLINQDMALEAEANAILNVDRMVRYHRDLFQLLKNFVTFYDFYSEEYKAIFQAGTLYIDQRSCDLCIKVNDMAKHTTMVSYSGMFLVYCNCTQKATNQQMTIVAALTNGDIDDLVVGRNALFYDRNGLDWDATIIKIVDNPISIRQAFWSPYRKVSRFIENQVNKVATEKDNKFTDEASKTVESAPGKIESHSEQTKTPPPPFDIGKFVGIFAAISLALGAIGTVIASVVTGFMGLTWWKMPIALMGVVVLISGPAMLMAYLKLRKRNLAPLLDANGWAINAKAVVNIRFGNTLTHLAELPKGAKVNLQDPFSKKKRPVLPILIAIVLLVCVVLYLLWTYELIHVKM
jgi:hypothetical protein